MPTPPPNPVNPQPYGTMPPIPVGHVCSVCRCVYVRVSEATYQATHYAETQEEAARYVSEWNATH